MSKIAFVATWIKFSYRVLLTPHSSLYRGWILRHSSEHFPGIFSHFCVRRNGIGFFARNGC